MPSHSTRHVSVIENLIAGVEPRPVARVVIGINWTLVEVGGAVEVSGAVEADGTCGLAQTPDRGAPGCRPLAGAGTLAKMPLNTLARRALSDNPMEIAVGMAAVNAHYNRGDLTGTGENGLDAFAGTAQPVVVVGRFPGVADRYAEVRVIEREPRDGEYPQSAAADLLVGAGGIIVTASTLVSGAFDWYLDLARSRGVAVAVVGPGTPLAPLLFDHGVAVLAGTVVTDAAGAARAVAEAGAVGALKDVSRFVTLRKPG